MYGPVTRGSGQSAGEFAGAQNPGAHVSTGARLGCRWLGQAGPGHIPAWQGLRHWHQRQRH